MLALGLAPVSAANADELRTRWVGAWHCDNGLGAAVPMAGARVELWQQDGERTLWFTDDSMIAGTYADANGAYEFNTVSDGEANFYVRVRTLNDDTSQLEWWTQLGEPMVAETGTNQNDKPLQNFGDVVWIDNDGLACTAWQAVRDAYLDFRAAVGESPPHGRQIVRGGTPQTSPNAPYTAINFPLGYDGTTGFGMARTAAHEFAHTFRASYDGDRAHYQNDVATYAYVQPHNLCSQINSGFAFNEGWADFWGGMFPANACNSAPTDYTYEGNVALALGGLERCYTPAELVDTLAQSPGSIHTYNEFETRLRALYGVRCQNVAPFNPGTGVPSVTRPDSGLSFAKYRSEVRDELSQESKTARLLRKRRERALDDLRDIGPCWRKREGCLPLVLNRIAPAIIGGQIAAARVLRQRLSFQLERKKLRKLGNPSTERFERALAKKANVIRRAVAKAQAKWLRRAIAAIRPILRRDRTPDVLSLATRLKDALAVFKRGRLPEAYSYPSAIEASVQPYEAPPPPPTEPPTEPPAAEPLPDLVVERVEWEDQCCTIFVDVLNAGAAPAVASTTAITQDGQSPVYVSTPALDPGQRAMLSIECVYGGTADAIARADAFDDAAESNEANNTAQGSGGVGGLCRYN